MAQSFLVFGAAAVTAAATGLGAIPFAFRRLHTESLLGVSNAIAAGVMLGASASLLYESSSRGLLRVGVGTALGAAFVLVLQRRLGSGDGPGIGRLTGVDARRALLVVAVMTAHSVAEGVGVGAAFGGGDTLGLAITVAIAIHNIPEGVAVSLVLVPRGASVARAAAWSVFTSLPQPLLAVPAFVFVRQFQGVLPGALGFAAGAMIWMASRELLPEAIRQLPRRRVAIGWASLACASMFGVQTYLLA